MKKSPLEGLKVVELASVLAGPAVGMFLAELGADVVKVENATTGGDVTRGWRLPTEDASAPRSAYYCAVNWKKEVRLLNLKDVEGRAAAYALIREADILLGNFTARAAKKLGMDKETLSRMCPSLIYANLTGFGAESNRPAFDVVLQAEAGFLYMNGMADGPPAKMPVALIDVLAAHQLKEGILLALLHRVQTGEGSYIETSLLESAVASLANQATNWLMGGHIPQRMGTQHPNIAPYGDIFKSRDGYDLIVAAGTEKQFLRLVEVLGAEEILENSAYRSNAERVKHRMVLCEALAPYFEKWLAEELLAACEEAGVPMGQVRNMQEVFEQSRASAMILEEEVEGQLTRRVRTKAFRVWYGWE